MIQTYLIYNLMLLGSTGLLYVRENIVQPEQVKLKLILLLAAFLIVTIPSAIRFEIGTDYYGYINIFNNINNYSHIELGFAYLTKFIRIFTDNPQWGIAVYAFLFSTLIFLSYPKEDAYIFNFIVWLIMLFPSFNIVRHSLAIALTLLSLKQYYQGRLLLSLTILGIGILFHTSTIILVPIYLLSLVPLSINFKAKIFPMIAILTLLIGYFFVSQLVYIMGDLVQYILPKYTHLVDSQRQFMKVTWGYGVIITAKILFVIIALFYSKFFLIKSNRYWLLLLLIYFFGISLIMAKEISIMERLMYVFIPAFIYIVFIMIEMGKNHRVMSILLYGFMLLIFLAFQKDILSIKTEYGDPMRAPYKTIFNKSVGAL
ncbi:EpsG family protein [Wohlfahrtiimonas chitiniclastica]|uniref:EpsG family protein n=1 Tax=Wohlfahrtiimonas chitiniclastica TaxID=400946 RepID=UPI001BD18F6B|nr:EpsG family protein [Wohlfahrtiimonas chitiniclastica]MBS7828722.1 EpsG family protein [Wohlfahrtiimonas chitiniclastica]